VRPNTEMKPRGHVFLNGPSTTDPTVAQCAHDLVARHPHFRGRATNFAYECLEGELVVRGCVPTYHLKQLLQTALTQLDGVRRIDNRVDVTSCDSLSSVREE
jgi:hypothetical protein